jgi:hypothetical protein
VNSPSDSDRKNDNPNIKKKRKSHQKREIEYSEESDIGKDFFLSRDFDLTNREKNIYLPPNLSKKDRKRAMKSAKIWTNEDLAKDNSEVIFVTFMHHLTKINKKSYFLQL